MFKNSTKLTPIKCKPINKALLTPCRQIGLSRIIKKTVNSEKKSLTTNTSAFTLQSITETCVEQSNNESHIPKKNFKKELPPNNQNENTFEKSSCDDTKSELTPEIVKINVHSNNINIERNIIGCNDKPPAQEVIKLKPKKKLQSISNHNSTKKTDLKEIKSEATKSTSKSKSSICLSMKNHQPSEIEEKSTSTNTPNEKTDSDGHSDIENENIGVVQNKLKRKLLLESSNEKDLDLVLSGKLIKTDQNNLQNKIMDIKKRIAQKEKYLVELKQAAVYKKLHNPNELNQLIDVWKVGCKAALERLLSKIQEHGSISLEKLLSNLNINPQLLSIDVKD